MSAGQWDAAGQHSVHLNSCFNAVRISFTTQGDVRICDPYNAKPLTYTWAETLVVKGSVQSSWSGSEFATGCDSPTNTFGCFTYSGSHTITVTPVTRDLVMFRAPGGTVTAGDSVTFTVSKRSGSASAPTYTSVYVRRWIWVPDRGLGPPGTATCGSGNGLNVCTAAVYQPGTMYGEVLQDGVVEQAFQWVPVTGPPDLTLACPASVVRDQEATCTASATEGGSLQVTGWAFVPADTAFSSITRSEDTTATTWGGRIVASGTVKVYGRVNGTLDSATATLEVSGRDWSGLTLPDSTWEDPTSGTLPTRPTDFTGQLGETQHSMLPAYGRFAMYIGSGPNTGFLYFQTMPVDSVRNHIFVNKTALSVNSSFYLKQDMQRTTVLINAATGEQRTYCGREAVVPTQGSVRQHENTHATAYTSRLETESRAAESLVFQGDIPAAVMSPLLRAWHDSAVAASTRIDTQYPVQMNCHFRFFDADSIPKPPKPTPTSPEEL